MRAVRPYLHAHMTWNRYPSALNEPMAFRTFQGAMNDYFSHVIMREMAGGKHSKQNKHAPYTHDRVDGMPKIKVNEGIWEKTIGDRQRNGVVR